MTESRVYRNGFEKTYPRYEFSELVRLAVVFGGVVARWADKRRRTTRRSSPKVDLAHQHSFPFVEL